MPSIICYSNVLHHLLLYCPLSSVIRMSSIICYSNVLCIRQSNVVCVCHSSVLCICHSNALWPLWFCHYNFLCIIFVVAFLLLIFQFSLQCNYRHHRFSVA